MPSPIVPPFEKIRMAEQQAAIKQYKSKEYLAPTPRDLIKSLNEAYSARYT